MRGMIIAVCLVAACGEDNGNGGPYVPLDQIDKAWKTAECKHLVMCGEFASQDACEAANINITFTVQAAAINGVMAGRMYYKGDVLAACFDAIATRTCDTTDADGRYDTVCNVSPFRGAQHAGDKCGLDAECISGVCSGNGGQGSACTLGTCVGDTAPTEQPPAAIGQPCAFGATAACVKGAYCDSTAASTCVALKTSGMACNTGSECDYGLGCVGSPNRTCKALPALGQPCPDFTCRDEGQVCGGTGQTCVAYALLGATCSGTTSATCSPYYQCDFSTTMKCIAYPTIGQSCASTSRCGDAGSYCDTTTQVCTALKANGSACTNSNQCQSDFCDTVNGNVCAVTSTCS